MRFVAEQPILARALQTASRIVSPQNTLPALAGVLVQAADDYVRISATDLTSLIETRVSANVETPGSVVIPAQTFADLIQRIPTADVRIEADEQRGQITVHYGRNRANLQGMAAQDMPTFPSQDTAQGDFNLAPGVLPRLARQTLFACARDESRPILKGVHMALGDGKVVMVSTDGTRLSQAWAAVPDLRGDPVSFVVAAKGLQEAARLAGSEAVVVTVGPKQIRFAGEAGALTTLLLEGRFPDYQRVLPDGFVVEATVDTAQFRGAIERVNLIIHHDHAAAIRVKHQPGVLELSSEAMDVGRAYEMVEVMSTGAEIELSFNPSLLLDGVKSMESEEMVLEFSGLQSPARLREKDSSHYFHIVLPLRQLV